MATPRAHSATVTMQAAAYVRMSTEHQRYSTENQAEAIRCYAEQRGIQVVRTYADEGKSGLKLHGRQALKQLLADVESGDAGFSVILVYDVSRWGRFQDADEGAYLEHLCRRAGIVVHYCAEQFENDGSLTATIIKSMKRAMAGEYSRELSTKVFAGKCRLVSLGFHQGGMAGFGLRRRLVDEERRPKAELRIGERKSLLTDRVILVPGPEAEVRTVRRMYRLFLEEHRDEAEIAALLNSEGIATDLGRRWTRHTVRQVLTNEKYVGHNVFNRRSFKLKKRRVSNPPDLFVRANGVFAPVVEPQTFRAAQAIIAARHRRFSDDAMLQQLASLFARAGYLSIDLIDTQPEMPSSRSYSEHFGGLLRAYALVGYFPHRDHRYAEANRFLRALYPETVRATIAAIEAKGGKVERNPQTDLLTINGEFTAAVVIVRCGSTETGTPRWKVRFKERLRPNITIAVRMQPGNTHVLDYYFLPRLDFPVTTLRLAEENPRPLDAYRSATLAPFLELAARTPIRRVA